MDPSPQSEGLFQLFDGNRSGVVDVREFMIALTNFAGAAKEDKLKFAFSIFDEDGNGVITKQEARKTISCRRHVIQTFCMFRPVGAISYIVLSCYRATIGDETRLGGSIGDGCTCTFFVIFWKRTPTSRRRTNRNTNPTCVVTF